MKRKAEPSSGKAVMVTKADAKATTPAKAKAAITVSQLSKQLDEEEISYDETASGDDVDLSGSEGSGSGGEDDGEDEDDDGGEEDGDDGDDEEDDEDESEDDLFDLNSFQLSAADAEADSSDDEGEGGDLGEEQEQLEQIEASAQDNGSKNSNNNSSSSNNSNSNSNAGSGSRSRRQSGAHTGKNSSSNTSNTTSSNISATNSSSGSSSQVSPTAEDAASLKTLFDLLAPSGPSRGALGDKNRDTHNPYAPQVWPADADFYETESDADEPLNTVGNVPMEWYADTDHIGYNLDGEKIMKSSIPKDSLDRFLAREDDPNYWRTVRDEMNDMDVVLTDQQLDLLRSLQRSRFPSDINPYEELPETPLNKDDIHHPLLNTPEPKRRFVQSKWEAQRVRKLMHSIRMGYILAPGAAPPPAKPRYYNIWGEAEDSTQNRGRIAAPKMKLPVHSESYRPPAEYLLNESELAEREQLDREDRATNYVPSRFDSLRNVPSYGDLERERFERCLDLYLCPRARRMKSAIDPESLMPTLPKPQDLLPFPTTEVMRYTGHKSNVRSISVSPSGQWLASGSDDKTVRVFEVQTGKCVRQWSLPGVVLFVAFCPNADVCVLSIAVKNQLLLVDCALGSVEQSGAAAALLTLRDGGGKRSAVTWELASPELQQQHPACTMLQITHLETITSISWHHKGDYFASVSPEGEHKSVLIHQLSRQQTQSPFSAKKKGKVQAVSFHPTKPFFILATQRHVSIYNLQKQQLAKKLLPEVQWISHIAVHPGGDNILLSSYDRRVCWFDLDYSTKPFKVLRYHKLAIRRVAYHKSYPLFASCSDDCTVHVFHGTVYADLLQNPLIVPVKILRGHDSIQNLGVLDVQWHPTQPWLFSSGADRTIRLFT